MANYLSQFSGLHNDQYDERITSLLNTITEQQQTISTQQQTIITLNNNLTTLTNKLAILESNITTFYTLWTGDAHEVNAVINLNDSIMNYKKIQFIFNVIPSRSPAFDVVADQPWYPQINTGSAWDITAVGNHVSLCTLAKNSNTKFTVATYIKTDNTYPYTPGIVKVIGFKTY